MITLTVHCGCGHQEVQMLSDIHDKKGWLCDKCNCLYDVWGDGRIDFSPLHKITDIDGQAEVTGKWLGIVSHRKQIRNITN